VIIHARFNDALSRINPSRSGSDPCHCIIYRYCDATIGLTHTSIKLTCIIAEATKRGTLRAKKEDSLCHPPWLPLAFLQNAHAVRRI
jgi:hypothetical protein